MEQTLLRTRVLICQIDAMLTKIREAKPVYVYTTEAGAEALLIQLKADLVHSYETCLNSQCGYLANLPQGAPREGLVQSLTSLKKALEQNAPKNYIELHNRVQFALHAMRVPV